MNIFYLKPDSIIENTGYFCDEESHHILNVLRIPEENLIYAVDGQGITYYGKLIKINKKAAALSILNTIQEETIKPSINMFVGLLKNRQRMEWMVEKLTETGVKSIVFLNTERTERSKLRLDRLEAIAITAMKQCMRASFPRIDLMNLNNIEALTGKTYVAHENEPVSHTYHSNNSDEINIFIGPEGGFSDNELNYLDSKLSAKRIWLGKLRLRTETAAIHTAGIFRYHNI